MYHNNPQFSLWSFHSSSLENSNKTYNVWSVSAYIEWVAEVIQKICMFKSELSRN